MAAGMKMVVFWDVALCNLVDIDQYSEKLTASSIHYPDDGGCKLI
jgi:hypothetical protein